MPSICAPICGDGKSFPGEDCDDNNTTDGDGCSSICLTENGYSCTGGNTTTRDTCSTICGDGITAGSEACDDSNSNDGDGCSLDCLTVELGYDCAAGPCSPICGDGIIIAPEECDDTVENGCSSQCKLFKEDFKASLELADESNTLAYLKFTAAPATQITDDMFLVTVTGPLPEYSLDYEMETTPDPKQYNLNLVVYGQILSTETVNLRWIDASSIRDEEGRYMENYLLSDYLTPKETYILTEEQ